MFLQTICLENCFPAFHSEVVSVFFPEMGLFPILRRGKVSTLWSSFFFSFMCFANCNLYLGCRVRSRPARTARPPVLLTAVYSANFSLPLSSFSLFISPPNPGPLTLIYSQFPSTHSRPCHLTRYAAASANQGSIGISPPKWIHQYPGTHAQLS